MAFAMGVPARTAVLRGQAMRHMARMTASLDGVHWPRPFVKLSALPAPEPRPARREQVHLVQMEFLPTTAAPAPQLSPGCKGALHTAAEQWQWLVDLPTPIQRPRRTVFARRPGVATRALHSVPQCRLRAQRLRRQVLGHLWRMELSLAGTHDWPQRPACAWVEAAEVLDCGELDLGAVSNAPSLKA